MALPELYSPDFLAVTGDDMTGNASPETLSDEFGKIAKFFDPSATHDSGNAGGIHKGNLATNSGIITDTTGTAANATNSVNATNVTTNINGHAITDILESDGVTAKSATSSGACTGNSATATKMDGVRVQGRLSTDCASTGVIPFNTAVTDPKSVFNTSTYRIVPGVGTYLVILNAVPAAFDSDYIASIRVNGTPALPGKIRKASSYTASGANVDGSICGLIVLSSPSDYIDFYLTNTSGSGISGGAITKSCFSVIQIA